MYVKWKGYDKSFNTWIDNKVDLSNYTIKTDLKNITHVNASSFALKTNLASLKTEVDNIDIEKVAPVLVDLIKLSYALKNNVAKNNCVW